MQDRAVTLPSSSNANASSCLIFSPWQMNVLCYTRLLSVAEWGNSWHRVACQWRAKVCGKDRLLKWKLEISFSNYVCLRFSQTHWSRTHAVWLRTISNGLLDILSSLLHTNFLFPSHCQPSKLPKCVCVCMFMICMLGFSVWNGFFPHLQRIKHGLSHDLSN